MAALATVLPKAIVASKSCGSDSNRVTSAPAAEPRSANCRVCHFLSENNAVSASEKKKLAPAKIRMTATAAIGAAAMPAAWPTKKQKAKGNRDVKRET
jgi:hypothetical protein